MRKPYEKIREIYDLNPDFFEHILEESTAFGGRYIENYKVNCSIIELNDNIVQLKLQYSYTTWNKNSRRLEFIFHREQSGRFERTFADDIYQLYEGAYYFDESTITKHISADELGKMYSVENLIVNDTPCVLRRKSDSLINQITYACDLGPQEDITQMKINFEVNVPLEKESFFTVDLCLPTRDFECSLNYARGANGISIAVYDLIGSRMPAVKSNDVQNGYVYVVNRSWMYPKSGVMFVWWKA